MIQCLPRDSSPTMLYLELQAPALSRYVINDYCSRGLLAMKDAPCKSTITDTTYWLYHEPFIWENINIYKNTLQSSVAPQFSLSFTPVLPSLCLLGCPLASPFGRAGQRRADGGGRKRLERQRSLSILCPGVSLAPISSLGNRNLNFCGQRQFMAPNSAESL